MLRTGYGQILSGFAVLLLTGFLTSAAMADAPQVTPIDGTSPLNGNPCTGAPGSGVLLIDGVYRFDPTFGYTLAIHGSYSFTPDDPSQPSYDGLFNLVSAAEYRSGQNADGRVLLHINATGTDGSRLELNQIVFGTTAPFTFGEGRCTIR
ncbi:MAG: hypothetical protein AABM40_14960 [Chloroflexota bacterium]